LNILDNVIYALSVSGDIIMNEKTVCTSKSFSTYNFVTYYEI